MDLPQLFIADHEAGTTTDDGCTNTDIEGGGGHHTDTASASGSRVGGVSVRNWHHNSSNWPSYGYDDAAASSFNGGAGATNTSAAAGEFASPVPNALSVAAAAKRPPSETSASSGKKSSVSSSEAAAAAARKRVEALMPVGEDSPMPHRHQPPPPPPPPGGAGGTNGGSNNGDNAGGGSGDTGGNGQSSGGNDGTGGGALRSSNGGRQRSKVGGEGDAHSNLAPAKADIGARADAGVATAGHAPGVGHHLQKLRSEHRQAGDARKPASITSSSKGSASTPGETENGDTTTDLLPITAPSPSHARRLAKQHQSPSQPKQQPSTPTTHTSKASHLSRISKKSVRSVRSGKSGAGGAESNATRDSRARFQGMLAAARGELQGGDAAAAIAPPAIPGIPMSVASLVLDVRNATAAMGPPVPAPFVGSGSRTSGVISSGTGASAFLSHAPRRSGASSSASRSTARAAKTAGLGASSAAGNNFSAGGGDTGAGYRVGSLTRLAMLPHPPPLDIPEQAPRFNKSSPTDTGMAAPAEMHDQAVPGGPQQGRSDARDQRQQQVEQNAPGRSSDRLRQHGTNAGPDRAGIVHDSEKAESSRSPALDQVPHQLKVADALSKIQAKLKQKARKRGAPLSATPPAGVTSTSPAFETTAYSHRGHGKHVPLAVQHTSKRSPIASLEAEGAFHRSPYHRAQQQKRERERRKTTSERAAAAVSSTGTGTSVGRTSHVTQTTNATGSITTTSNATSLNSKASTASQVSRITRTSDQSQRSAASGTVRMYSGKLHHEYEGQPMWDVVASADRGETSLGQGVGMTNAMSNLAAEGGGDVAAAAKNAFSSAERRSLAPSWPAWHAPLGATGHGTEQHKTAGPGPLAKASAAAACAAATGRGGTPPPNVAKPSLRGQRSQQQAQLSASEPDRERQATGVQQQTHTNQRHVTQQQHRMGDFNQPGAERRPNGADMRRNADSGFDRDADVGEGGTATPNSSAMPGTGPLSSELLSLSHGPRDTMEAAANRELDQAEEEGQLRRQRELASYQHTGVLARMNADDDDDDSADDDDALMQGMPTGDQDPRNRVVVGPSGLMNAYAHDKHKRNQKRTGGGESSGTSALPSASKDGDDKEDEKSEEQDDDDYSRTIGERTFYSFQRGRALPSPVRDTAPAEAASFKSVAESIALARKRRLMSQRLQQQFEREADEQDAAEAAAAAAEQAATQAHHDAVEHARENAAAEAESTERRRQVSLQERMEQRIQQRQQQEQAPGDAETKPEPPSASHQRQSANRVSPDSGDSWATSDEDRASGNVWPDEPNISIPTVTQPDENDDDDQRHAPNRQRSSKEDDDDGDADADHPRRRQTDSTADRQVQKQQQRRRENTQVYHGHSADYDRMQHATGAHHLGDDSPAAPPDIAKQEARHSRGGGSDLGSAWFDHGDRDHEQLSLRSEEERDEVGGLQPLPSAGAGTRASRGTFGQRSFSISTVTEATTESENTGTGTAQDGNVQPAIKSGQPRFRGGVIVRTAPMTLQGPADLNTGFQGVQITEVSATPIPTTPPAKPTFSGFSRIPLTRSSDSAESRASKVSQTKPILKSSGSAGRGVRVSFAEKVDFQTYPRTDESRGRSVGHRDSSSPVTSLNKRIAAAVSSSTTSSPASSPSPSPGCITHMNINRERSGLSTASTLVPAAASLLSRPSASSTPNHLAHNQIPKPLSEQERPTALEAEPESARSSNAESIKTEYGGRERRPNPAVALNHQPQREPHTAGLPQSIPSSLDRKQDSRAPRDVGSAASSQASDRSQRSGNSMETAGTGAAHKTSVGSRTKQAQAQGRDHPEQTLMAANPAQVNVPPRAASAAEVASKSTHEPSPTAQLPDPGRPSMLHLPKPPPLEPAILKPASSPSSGSAGRTGSGGGGETACSGSYEGDGEAGSRVSVSSIWSRSTGPRSKASSRIMIRNDNGKLTEVHESPKVEAPAGGAGDASAVSGSGSTLGTPELEQRMRLQHLAKIGSGIAAPRASPQASLSGSSPANSSQSATPVKLPSGLKILVAEDSMTLQRLYTHSFK